MTNAVYTQALSPDPLHIAQSLTGLKGFLCPADVHEQLVETAQLLRQFSPVKVPRTNYRQVLAFRGLDQLQVISGKNTGLMESNFLVDVESCNWLIKRFITSTY